MNKSSDIPLTSFQVLEEEYHSLYGPLPAGVGTVHLPDARGLDPPDSPPSALPSTPPPGTPGVGTKKGAGDGACRWREVDYARDWDFRRGHIKDPVLFAALLIPLNVPEFDAIPPDLKQMIPAHDLARENLKRHVYGKVNRKTLTELVALRADGVEREATPALAEMLESELNDVLADEDFYHSDRFSKDWLSPQGRGLIALREALGGFKQPDDLKHFNRVLLEDAFPGLEKIEDIRFAAVCRKLHDKGPTALSLSGGGIRSGTFALGLLQGLARHNLLKEFDYLSTVSGGGYIGGWLTAWLHRHPEGLEGVTRDLANSPPAHKVDPDPAPLLYLRQFSNFITPKVGLLTADTWSFVGIYFRNLLLNWMVFIPLVAAVLLLPRLLLTAVLVQPVPSPAWFALPFVGYGFHLRHVFLVLGFLLGVWALGYIDFNRPGLRQRLWEKSRTWRERADQRGFLKYCLVPLLASAVLLTVYFAWSGETRAHEKDFIAFLVFGLAFVTAGGLISSVVLRRFQRGKDAKGNETKPSSSSWLFYVGALFGAGLSSALLFYALAQCDFGNPVVGYGGTSPEYLRWQGLLFWKSEFYVCFAVPAFLLVFWGATTVFVGVSSRFNPITDEDREWWARFGAWLIIAAIVWTGGATLVIFGPLALLESPRLLAAAGGLSGLFALLLGRSAKTPGHKEQERQGGTASKLMGQLLPLLAVVFLASFFAAISLGTTYVFRAVADVVPNPAEAANAATPCDNGNLVEWMTNAPCDYPSVAGTPPAETADNAKGFADYLNYLSPPWPQPQPQPQPGRDDDGEKGERKDEYPALTRAQLIHMNVLHHTSLWFVGALGGVLATVGVVLSYLINLNIFSLHGGYRNRLIRAFLGASRPEGERRANPFTGFDEADNIPMHELRPGLLDEDDLLDPAGLRNVLTTPTGEPPAPHDALTQYLAGKIDNVRKATANASSELITALRTDLNRVLEEESLYTQFDGFMRSRRAQEVRRRVLAAHGAESLERDRLRTDYHILLNRLVLEQAYPKLIKPAPYPPPPYKLLHIINTALNLVGGDNLAWQQRKAEPFTVSPLHAGCFRLGYRQSRDYGGRDTGGISVGTAAAISGAAASSNMGYYTTSPIMSLLLTLFNVRLGWWLGNPGPHGHATFEDRAPRNSVMPVIYEAFGMTDDRNPYVYLSDGGHFENLALYEMVLRRCRVIICSDGAQDEDYRFGDLGNAVRKIRIDLGIPIEFTSLPIYAEPPAPEKGRGFYWAVGRVRYSSVDYAARDGVIIYLKPAVYGTEPRDVLEYKKSFPAFPHQSTGDQFFDEPQFESYRALGSHAMDAICGEGTHPFDIDELVRKSLRPLVRAEKKTPPPGPTIESWLRHEDEEKAWLRNIITTDWLTKTLTSDEP